MKNISYYSGCFVVTGLLVLSGAGPVLGAVQAANNTAPQTIAIEKSELQALQARVAELQGKIDQLEHKAGYDNDPFAMIDSMEQNMQAMLLGPYGPGAGLVLSPNAHRGLVNPDYDIKDNGRAYELIFDMPGMDKAKINVSVNNGFLQVSGERSSESSEGQGNKMYRQQRSFGYVSRSIMLPKDARPDSVQAKYDNGVLKVTVDKKEPAAQKNAPVKVEVK
ncbi:MAG: Hsp20/alpha crystallin family protein [Candidatus Omnitrophica bacterium]|nr:Hsp20/alpha crystallin family protein [Candidatus Omnitrophota bacterium]